MSLHPMGRARRFVAQSDLGGIDMKGVPQEQRAKSITAALLAEMSRDPWREFDHYRKKLEEALGRDRKEIAEQFWRLVGEGLIYTNMGSDRSTHWGWGLSRVGQRAAEDQHEFQPYDPDGYLAQLQERIPSLDGAVLTYAEESLRCFNARCHAASSVMLGVASEKAFLLMAGAFADWLPSSEGSRFRNVLEDPRQSFSKKFQEFRKRTEPRRSQFPKDFAENMSLNMDAVCDLIRIYRNESGHPTGKRVDPNDAYINLQMFARYLEKVFGLIAFFRSRLSAKEEAL